MAGIAAHLPKSSRGPVARNSARTGHAEESARGATRRGAARRISPGCVSCFSRRPTRSSLASPTKIRALSLSLSPTVECYRFKTGYPKHEFSARPAGWKGDEGGRREKRGDGAYTRSVRVCVRRRESDDERVRGATNEGEEADNSMPFGRTKVVTLRTSCPTGREKRRERQRLGGKGDARARCESNFPR